MDYQYSSNFKALIEGDVDNSLIEGSFVNGSDFSNWEKQRSFIAKLINQDGKILDIGCANGFLLRCLQEWSNFELDPYGIDSEKHLIKQAKLLFQSKEGHFLVADIKEISNLAGKKLPEYFDIIYWNVWDNWRFTSDREIEPLIALINLLAGNGRLILGFYDNDGKNNTKRIKKLSELDYPVADPISNPYYGEKVLLTYIDKNGKE